MPQVTGFPGGGLTFGNRVRLLTGIGDPNSSSTGDVQTAAVGSIYLRTDAPNSNSVLYVCNVGGIIEKGVTLSVATWTAK